MQVKEKEKAKVKHELLSSALKPVDHELQHAGADAVYLAKDRGRKYSWSWNIPLLLVSVAVLAIGGSAATGLYLWQSHRLSTEMLKRAAAAESVKDYKTQAQWLGRYVHMEPTNTDAVIQLAIATDNGVKNVADVFRARTSLSNAIGATGELPAFESQRVELRHRLIKRLLKLGGYFSAEAEQQVILLAAPPEDPQALSWLARGVASQQLNKMGGQRKGSKLNKSEDYWKWLASQPVGFTIREALKHDTDNIDIAALFLNAVLDNAAWFEGGPESVSPEQLQQEANDVCQRLVAKQDNGQAQLIAYSYLSRTEKHAGGAEAQLEAARVGALKRLAENLKPSATAPTEADDELNLPNAEVILLDEDDYDNHWDWELALASAANAASENRWQDAQAIYQQLIELVSPAVNRTQVEATFLSAGHAYLKAQDPEKAIETWSAGAEAVKESIELANALASVFTELERTDEAAGAIKNLETYINKQLARLEGPQGAELSVGIRNESRQRLEQARWRATVLNGTLKTQTGDFRDATELLSKAYHSPLAVEPEERVQAGRVLAECYGKQQLWDLAGQTLDGCITMQPTDVGLRRMAAKAWSLSGSPERATTQVETLDDGSFGAALEIARIKATSQAAQPQAQANSLEVQKAIHVARLRWESLSEKEQVGQPFWILEMLEAAHPDNQTASPEQAYQRLQKLADSRPNVAEIQMIAAFHLADHGEIADAKKAFLRFQKLAEVSGKPSDAATAVIIEAKIKEETEGVDAALAVLRRGIQTVPQEALRLAKAGASVGLMQKQPEVALEFLKMVPEKNWDVDALMMAGRLGTRSGDVTTGVAVADSDIERWEAKLRQLEGDEGCNWRYLAAQRLIQNASRRRDHTEPLNQAQKYFNEIDRIRPRWGMGAALGGQIAVLKGSHNEAITLLRRAIRDGDTQASTVLALVSELTATGQFDQAQQELQRLAGIPENILPTSQTAISLARRRGDLRTALDLARKSTTRNRNEASAWLVAYQTAVALSRSRDVAPDEKTNLQTEAWDALEQATRLTEGKDLTVWNERFRFQLERGDKSKAQQELEALQASSVPRNASLVAAAAGYLQLQNFESAQARAQEAMALDPNAAQPHVVMARIHERLGDRASALSELQAAHRLDDKSSDIRERLAIAYVLGSDEIPWSEVDRLLNSAESEGNSARSPLLRAVLSLKRGDDSRVQVALASLHTIAESEDAESATAQRILAQYFGTLWLKASPHERDSLVGRKNLLQARSLYEKLLNRAPPAPTDGLAFAVLLIEAGELEEATQVVDKLSSAGTSPFVLQLRLKIAKLQGEDVSKVASTWIASATGYEEEQLWEMVGKTMSQLEFNEEALEWLEKVYRKDPTRFMSYASGLAKVGQTDKAINLCLARIEQDGNLEAATLLPEIVLLNTAEAQSDAVEQALAAAVKKHSDSAPLLEAVATLRLLQERYAEAVALYEQVDRLDPNRPRTLNNLAIALTELPMRSNTALEKINKAIQLYGKHPQLLDTLAIVHSKLGQHDKAKAALQEVLAREKDPRSQMRLVEELVALGESSEAEQTWSEINLDQLKAMRLTPAEERSFTKLSKELGTH